MERWILNDGRLHGGKIEEECVLMICYINHLMMHDGVDLFASIRNKLIEGCAVFRVENIFNCSSNFT